MPLTGRKHYRYSESFKIEVIKELESGKFSSISEASRHYDIAGSMTVSKWLSKYGRNQLLPKAIRVEKPDEQDRFNKLKQENKQLKEALADTHMQSLLNEAFFEELCEQVGVDPEDFKKKVNSRQLNVSRRSRQKIDRQKRR